MIGGSSDVDQESMGAFQEFPQVCKTTQYFSYAFYLGYSGLKKHCLQ